MKASFIILTTLLFLTTSPTFAQPLLSESFETGDLSAGQGAGFSWSGINRTSLVKQDPALGNTVVFNKNGMVQVAQGAGKNWTAKDGQISLRFDFPAGKGGWAEQRFSLDAPQTELWTRYWLRVPANFKHSSNSPSNNKLFALWMDNYSSKGAGPTVIWEFWNDGSNGSNLAYHYSPGGHRTAGSHKQRKPFIQYPVDQGRWMQIVMHVKAASGPSMKDGVIQLYRRWADEASFTLLHDDQNADIAAPAQGPYGWQAGYFMGWSNPGYAEATEWLLDDLIISNTSLLESAQPH